jgi:hypothetical protein
VTSSSAPDLDIEEVCHDERGAHGRRREHGRAPSWQRSDMWPAANMASADRRVGGEEGDVELADACCGLWEVSAGRGSVLARHSREVEARGTE